MTDPAPGGVVVFVAAPPSGSTAHEYWTGVLTSVCTYLSVVPPVDMVGVPPVDMVGVPPVDTVGLPPVDTAGPFRALSVVLERADVPVVLVLDGVHTVDSVEERVAELLARSPRLRIIVTTRVKGAWPRYLEGRADRVMLTPDALVFTVEETAAYLRASAVPRDPRSVRWITRRAEGLPALIFAIRKALHAAGVQVAMDKRRLDGLIDAAVDGLVREALGAGVPESVRGPVEPSWGYSGPVRESLRRIDARFALSAGAHRALASDPASVFEEIENTARHDHAVSCLRLGTTWMLADRVDDATVMFRRAHIGGTGTSVGRDAAGKLALAYAMRGACNDARSWMDEEARQAVQADEGEGLVRTAGLVAAVLVALDRFDTDAASVILAELGTPAADDEFWAFVLYVHGQHALVTGMPADGLRYIDLELQRYSPVSSDVSRTLLDTVRADLHLALGQADRAQHLVMQSTHSFTAPVRARIRLLTGDPSGAEAIVYHYSADPSCSPRESMELAVLGAAAACAVEDRAEARRHMNRAVVLSRQTGLLRPYGALPPLMVRDITSLGVELTVEPDRVTPECAIYCMIDPDVQLTARESAVLAALVAGGTAATIATAQFVSVNTIKTQLRSLYRKLGVNSRRDAIATARRLTLA